MRNLKKAGKIVGNITKKLSPFGITSLAMRAGSPAASPSSPPSATSEEACTSSVPPRGADAIRAVIMSTTPPKDTAAVVSTRESSAEAAPLDLVNSPDSWLGAAASCSTSLSPQMRPSVVGTKVSMDSISLFSDGDLMGSTLTSSSMAEGDPGGPAVSFGGVQQWQEKKRSGRKNRISSGGSQLGDDDDDHAKRDVKVSKSADHLGGKTGKYLANALRLEWLLGRGGIDLLLGDDSELDGSLRGAFNLPGKLTADVVAYEIKSSKGQIFDARPHVEYLIKCAMRSEGSSGKIVKWSVSRRYNTFHVLHKRLRSKYARMEASLPKKNPFRLFRKFDGEYLQQRKSELNDYLRQVLDDPNVSDAKELRLFLSPDSELNIVTAPLRRRTSGRSRMPSISLSDGEAESITRSSRRNDEAASPQPSFHTLQTPVTNRLKTTIASSAAAVGRRRSAHYRDKRRAKAILKAHKINKISKRKVLRSEVKRGELRLFALVDEVFRFRSMGVLRRNIANVAKAVVRFSFHGKLRTWLNENFHTSKSCYTSTTTHRILRDTRHLLWPNDQLGIQDDAGNNVSDEEAEAARAAVRHGLSSALPASLIALIGRKPVEAGLRKAHDFTQCPRLVKNLLYEVLDLLVTELFPNVTMQELRGKA